MLEFIPEELVINIIPKIVTSALFIGIQHGIKILLKKLKHKNKLSYQKDRKKKRPIRSDVIYLVLVQDLSRRRTPRSRLPIRSSRRLRRYRGQRQ